MIILYSNFNSIQCNC